MHALVAIEANKAMIEITVRQKALEHLRFDEAAHALVYKKRRTIVASSHVTQSYFIPGAFHPGVVGAVRAIGGATRGCITSDSGN